MYVHTARLDLISYNYTPSIHLLPSYQIRIRLEKNKTPTRVLER